MTSSLARAFAAAILLFAATDAAARDLVVGQVVEYSGKHGEASRDYVAGAKVYFDSVNARGGVNGMRIRHAVLDATSEGAIGARTRELIDETHADVLFGFVGDEALEAAAAERELIRGGIALVGPLSGRDAPSAAAAGIFFARPPYEAEVRQIVGHFRVLQVTRFTVVRAADEHGRRLGEMIEKELAASRLQSAGVLTLGTSGAADVDAVRARGAQAVIVVADTIPAAEFIKRYRPADPGAMIVMLSTVNHRTMFELLGPTLAHGVMVTQVVPNPLVAESPLLKEHLDAIRTFRDEPPSHLTLEGFIAAKALIEGVRRAGPNPGREQILAAFRRLGKLDLRGVVLDFSRAGRGEGTFVDLAMIRRNGALLR